MKSLFNHLLGTLFFALLGIALWSCGSDLNLYSIVETGSVADQATYHLEKREYDAAIKLLESGLADEPNNSSYKSLLATALSEKHGISLLDIALSFAEQTTASSDGILSSFGFLPEPTETNLADLSRASALMRSIPSAELIAADSFKASILSMSLMSLRLKSIDLDGDGSFDVSELQNLSLEDAIAVVGDFATAATFAAEYAASALGDSSGEIAEQISAMQQELENSPGADVQEQLSNYLQNN